MRYVLEAANHRNFCHPTDPCLAEKTVTGGQTLFPKPLHRCGRVACETTIKRAGCNGCIPSDRFHVEVAVVHAARIYPLTSSSRRPIWAFVDCCPSCASNMVEMMSSVEALSRRSIASSVVSSMLNNCCRAAKTISLCRYLR